MADQDPWKRRGKSLRNQSLALLIPSFWLGGPLGVGFLGYLIGKHFDKPDTGAVLGVFLGILIAIRETVRTLKILNRDS